METWFAGCLIQAGVGLSGEPRNARPSSVHPGYRQLGNTNSLVKSEADGEGNATDSSLPCNRP
jgi:hypothetical protein